MPRDYTFLQGEEMLAEQARDRQKDTDVLDPTLNLWLAEQCNRWANGQCLTRRCLLRGGYSGSGPVDNPDCATCEAKEIAAKIAALQASVAHYIARCKRAEAEVDDD